MIDVDVPIVPPAASAPGLRRVLTFWPLVLYGLGVIVGAGIYVAIGTVIARAGGGAPLSFLLAGLVAALTGLCYAELASRFPDASGAVVYVKHGFGSDRLAQLVGAAVTLAVAVSAASIARGAITYLAVLLPVPPPLLTAGLIGAFTVVAIAGVRESVGLAAAIGALEIGGLIVAIAAGVLGAPAFDTTGLLPTSLEAGWGVVAGAFIAFFAFIGFETLANLAEEVKEPRRTLPRGIVGAIAASVVLYVAVAIVAVLAHRTDGNPLLGIFDGKRATAFAVVGFLAVSNGVLVHIVMLARLFYGMARHRQLPAPLARIDPRTRTPIAATVLAGGIVLAAALAVSFEDLLIAANAITLGVFVMVDAALWHVKRRAPPATGQFTVPRCVPPLAALLAFGLMLAELVR